MGFWWSAELTDTFWNVFTTSVFNYCGWWWRVLTLFTFPNMTQILGHQYLSWSIDFFWSIHQFDGIFFFCNGITVCVFQPLFLIPSSVCNLTHSIYFPDSLFSFLTHFVYFPDSLFIFLTHCLFPDSLYLFSWLTVCFLTHCLFPDSSDCFSLPHTCIYIGPRVGSEDKQVFTPNSAHL
jgi:hypothetical protein